MVAEVLARLVAFGNHQHKVDGTLWWYFCPFSLTALGTGALIALHRTPPVTGYPEVRHESIILREGRAVKLAFSHRDDIGNRRTR
jgi:hypothetical protein